MMVPIKFWQNSDLLKKEHIFPNRSVYANAVRLIRSYKQKFMFQIIWRKRMLKWRHLFKAQEDTTVN